ncbi:MAG: S49 family peptidase [Gammaproteobacteria bacterium]|nr:MAG: S49 family peptidase [Gammaproteobacteria bacterium]
MSEQQSSHHQAEFERALVNKIASEAITEQRRARRWSVFFKLFMVGYISIFTIYYLVGGIDGPSLGGEKHTALIDISGIISADSEASADYIVSGLRAAFEDKNTAGIILRINSPGGSPVQAGYVNDEIYRLRDEYPDIPIYSVITDVCASGGYYIAAAADKIYADKASVVGSIGVIMSGFGFVDSIEKLGIERRLLHAGKNKGFLDPFSPLKAEDVEHVETLLTDIHQQFVDAVMKGRGDRLANDEKIFSGLIWTGEQSIALGLVDALGSAGYVAREVIGVEEIVDFTKRESFLDRFANEIGATFARAIGTTLTGFDIR